MFVPERLDKIKIVCYTIPNRLFKKGDEKMKEKYEAPAMEVVVFETEDVITTSGTGLGEGGCEEID